MEIKVKVPEALAAQAHAKGLKLETFVEQLLAEQLEASPGGTVRPRSPVEIRTWLDSLAQFSDKIPPLPETITREWIYQEHD